MYKFLAYLLCFSCVSSMDTPTQSSAWYEGLEIKCCLWDRSFYEGTLSSDESFTDRFRLIGLSKEEIIEIQQFPSPEYTLLPLLEKGDPPINLENWITIYENEAVMLDNPTDQHILMTNGLINCVGVAILSAHISFFAHVTIEDQIDDTLIGKFSQEELEEAKVILVSGCFSRNFSRTYKALKKAGCRKFFLDIEPIIRTDSRFTYTSLLYVKASTLRVALERYSKRAPSQLEHDLQKHFPVPAERSLIINAKTGELYSIKPREERHLEPGILWEWIKKYELESNFLDYRFFLPDLEEEDESDLEGLDEEMG
ncbi:MAG: hypothetical protein K0M45_04720 [Candidatus Paracaedibacteraceae bacterium]|nr:hypothetical protein [Candidatus Paracaedibacteraceae bacterium]